MKKKLIDLLCFEDVQPLLQSACRAGASRAEIRNASAETLWDYGLSGYAAVGEAIPGFTECKESLFIEGEPSGSIWLLAPEDSAVQLTTIALVISGALNAVITSNLKRMLTTEIHTQVINQSYDDLLAANGKLKESEGKYRELAESLEIRVHERTAELKQAYALLVEQDKMASIGQLAAGVAHEINNPLGFVHSNLFSLQTYLTRFVDMLQFYRNLPAGLGSWQEDAQNKWKELKIDFMLEDIVALFEESIGGAERVKKIVADLKGFSHVDALGPEDCDLETELDRALLLLGHETPPETEVEKTYQALPPVHLEGGKLGQVILNLLRNALQTRGEGLRLALATGRDEKNIWFSVADNGPGVPAELGSKIFEPFFTTRDVGAGTGLGLSVVYNILDEWGGSIALTESPLGGACFKAIIPIESPHG